jgi:Flavoprotein
VLYVVACAAPPVLHIGILLDQARARGWDVCLITTPTAARWLADQAGELAAATGHPVRSAYKLPGEPDVLPPPDAIAVAPATSNTINKWAAGLSDNLALGLITEAIGMGLPLVALPCLNDAQAAHPAFARSAWELRDAGVSLITRADVGEASDDAASPAGFPWHLALDALDALGEPGAPGTPDGPGQPG